MKRIAIGIAVVVLALVLASIRFTYASVPVCAITGDLTTIYGAAAANQRVSYTAGPVQVPSGGGVVIPGGSSCSVFTNSSGALPGTGNCTSFVQGSIMTVTVGVNVPVQIQIPTQSSADLSTLILANSDPPSLVSQIALTGCSGCTVTNPGSGAIGTATINLAGGILPSPSIAGQLLFTNAAGSAAVWASSSQDVTYSGSTIGQASVVSSNAFAGRGTNPTITGFSVNGVVNVKAEVNGSNAAAGNGVYLTDLYSSGTTLYSAGSHLSSSMDGGTVILEHAGPSGYSNQEYNDFSATLSSCTTSQCTMSGTPTVTFSSGHPGAGLIEDALDTTAIQAAVTSANTAAAQTYVPAGYYIMNGTFDPCNLRGDGPDKSFIAQSVILTESEQNSVRAYPSYSTCPVVHWSNVSIWYDGFHAAPGQTVVLDNVWFRRGLGVVLPTTSSTTGRVTLTMTDVRVMDSEASDFTSDGGNYVTGSDDEFGPAGGTGNVVSNGPDTIRLSNAYIHDQWNLASAGGAGIEAAVNTDVELTNPTIDNISDGCVVVEQAHVTIVGGSMRNCADWRSSTDGDWYHAISIKAGVYDEVGVTHFSNDDTRWRADAPYLTGDIVIVRGNQTNYDSSIGTYFTASAGCTTGFVKPNWPASGNITDGSCTWSFGGDVWLWTPSLAVALGDLVVPSQYTVADTGLAADPALWLYKVTTAGTTNSTEPTWSSYMDYGATPSDGSAVYSLVHVPQPGYLVVAWNSGAGASTTWPADSYITPGTPNGYIYKNASSCTPGSSFSPGTTLGTSYSDGSGGCSWKCEGYYRIPSNGLTTAAGGSGLAIGSASSTGSTFYRIESVLSTLIEDGTWYGDASEAAGSRSSVGDILGFQANEAVKGGSMHWVHYGVEFDGIQKPLVQNLKVDQFDYGIGDQLATPNMASAYNGNERILNNVLSNGHVDGVYIAASVNTTARQSGEVLSNVFQNVSTPMSIDSTASDYASGSIVSGVGNAIEGVGLLPNFVIAASAGTSGYSPTITGCAPGSLSYAQGNFSFEFEAGATATCTATFSTDLPFQYTPFCNIFDYNSNTVVGPPTASATAITWSATANHYYGVICN